MKTKQPAPDHVRQAAKRTRQFLQQGVWVQGAFHRQTEKGMGYCLLGAIDSIGLELQEKAALKSYLNKLFSRKWKKRWVSIVEWNDARGRTKKEVLAVLREVEKS